MTHLDRMAPVHAGIPFQAHVQSEVSATIVGVHAVQQIPKSFMLAGLACAISLSSASAAPLRQWVDSSGTFTLKAELVEVKDGNVRL